MDPLAYKVASRFLNAAKPKSKPKSKPSVDPLPRGTEGITNLLKDIEQVKKQLTKLQTDWAEVRQLPPTEAVKRLKRMLTSTLSEEGVLKNKTVGMSAMIDGLRDAAEEFIKDVSGDD